MTYDQAKEILDFLRKFGNIIAQYYYYYYHCDKTCKYRINSEIANEKFINKLNRFKPLAPVKKLYSAVLLEAYREHTGFIAREKHKALAQIAEYEKKMSVARNLLVTEKI